MSVFWDVALCIVVYSDWHFRGAYCLHHQGLVMETMRTSETSVYFNEITRPYIPQDCNIYTWRRKNVKSHSALFILVAMKPEISQISWNYVRFQILTAASMNMMEGVLKFETSVNFHENAQRSIPERSHIHLEIVL
jgi:hypothetical protein